MPRLIDRPDLQPAVALFRESVEASRMHSALAKRALEEHGAHGPDISGVVRDHFPDETKNTLRALARRVAEKSDAAYAARPPRVRVDTMRKLGREVATTHGSGFYGPQPHAIPAATRDPDSSDLNSAARGLGLWGMTSVELTELVEAHRDKPEFASKVIAEAAAQVRAAKWAMKPRDNPRGPADRALLERAITGVDDMTPGELEDVLRHAETEADNSGLPIGIRRVWGSLANHVRAQIKRRGSERKNPRRRAPAARSRRKYRAAYRLRNGVNRAREFFAKNDAAALSYAGGLLRARKPGIPKSAELVSLQYVGTVRASAKKKSKRNPAPASEVGAELEQAREAFQRFTGHSADTIERHLLPEFGAAAWALGPVSRIGYIATRDGELAEYVHEFSESSRPLLVASADGETALMLGGAYRVTDRGIVDDP